MIFGRKSGFFTAHHRKVLLAPKDPALLPEIVYLGMEVNDALIDNLAKLSRLSFNEEEKQVIKKDLEKMIGFVDKLKELDTSGVEPLLHMSDAVNVLRDDEVKGSVSRQEALANAPETDGNFFLVPKVIKK